MQKHVVLMIGMLFTLPVFADINKDYRIGAGVMYYVSAAALDTFYREVNCQETSQAKTNPNAAVEAYKYLMATAPQDIKAELDRMLTSGDFKNQPPGFEKPPGDLPDDQQLAMCQFLSAFVDTMLSASKQHWDCIIETQDLSGCGSQSQSIIDWEAQMQKQSQDLLFKLPERP